jgi:oligopeptide transport system permease protein
MSQAAMQHPELPPAAAPELVAGTSLWLDAWKRLRKNRLAVASAMMMGAIVVACTVGPTVTRLLWGHTFDHQDLDYGAQPPTWSAHTLVPGQVAATPDGSLVIETPWGERATSDLAGASDLEPGDKVTLWHDGRASDLERGDVSRLRLCRRCTRVTRVSSEPPHWLGTDFHGRDLATRMFKGGQISLLVGLLAAVVSATIGILVGAVAGYAGGRVDAVLMRFVDIMYSLPYMFFVIILVTVLGKQLWLIFVALGAVGWLTTARIVRGQVLSLKEREFVLAARSVGARGGAIVRRHLIPNALGPVIVYFTLTVPTMMREEAFLSFLGLGVQPPNASLGWLINEGANQMLVYWWTLVFPGVLLAVLLFALNFMGDGLRDAIDPRMG